MNSRGKAFQAESQLHLVASAGEFFWWDRRRGYMKPTAAPGLFTDLDSIERENVVVVWCSLKVEAGAIG
jgi:hypothetical protein